jgi:hypothetical protein
MLCIKYSSLGHIKKAKMENLHVSGVWKEHSAETKNEIGSENTLGDL